MPSESTIRKLEAVANDPQATPAEREAYRAKAAKLRGVPPFVPPYFPYREVKKVLQYWTEIKTWYSPTDIVETCCCCHQPGATRRQCSDGREHPIKTACRCACHQKRR